MPSWLRTRVLDALLGATVAALLLGKPPTPRVLPRVETCANVMIQARSMKEAKACWFAMKTKSATELREVLDQPHNCEPFCVHRQKVRFAIR